MALTILERLSGEPPKGMLKKNASLKKVLALVRRHMAEIEEARERKYSWAQIDDACRESWQVETQKAAGIHWWRTGLIESCYRSIKSGTPLWSKKNKEPLSLNVTITKE